MWPLGTSSGERKRLCAGAIPGCGPQTSLARWLSCEVEAGSVCDDSMLRTRRVCLVEVDVRFIVCVGPRVGGVAAL